MDSMSSIRDSVLAWLETMRIAPARYRMNAGVDDTHFTTCFALYILDLFGETERFSTQEREQWVSRIQSCQDPEDGYFRLPEDLHPDPERSRHQLTCFCLSALRILDAEPRHALKFLDNWPSPEAVREYLSRCGCHQGRPGSGNKAMFLGIFLTRALEQTGDPCFRPLLEAWFAFHDEQQNANGFWGADRASLYMHGLQNGLHQLVVYFYWQRPHARLERIVDVALMSQDRDGFFSSTPGGVGCHDYDAIHILATAHRLSAYRRSHIEASLERAIPALRSTINEDGGFCQSKKTVTTAGQLLRRVPGFFAGRHPYLWYYRARKTAGVYQRKKQVIETGWTRGGRRWTDSNLWDTWFRCLALAEIQRVRPTADGAVFDNCRFHEMIGLGHFGVGGDPP